MDPAIGGLAQGLNTAIQQYMGMNVQQMQGDYQSQQQFQQKKGLMDYEQGQKMQFENYQNSQELIRQSALEAYKQSLEGQIDGDTAAEMHPKAFGLVKNFKLENKRWPTVDEADKLFKPLQQDEQKELNRLSRIDTSMLNYTEKLENNHVLKKMEQQGIDLDVIGELTSLAQGGNTIAGNALGTKMARAMGEVGALTDSDVTKYVESKQLSRMAADKLSKWMKGKPSDATVEEIGEIANVLNASYKVKTQPIYDKYVNRLSENMGISKEEAARRLDVPYSGMTKGKGAKTVGGVTLEKDSLGLF